MHIHKLDQWTHDHRYLIDSGQGERNTWRVIVLTSSMMIVEIAAGIIFGSMALLADGWHMGTHASALGITVFAYYYARKHQDDPSYTFGTGKVGVLGGFASAVVLAVVALLMGVESIQRFFQPVVIRFNEAIAVAVIGLIVNLVSAYLLRGHHHHADDADTDDDDHRQHHHHQDHNLRSAYFHVLADALTSLLAIVALITGKAFGWVWMDPCMGVVGALVILRWSYGLLRDSSKVLLDSDVNPEAVEEIRQTVQADADNRVADLHVWRVGPQHLAAIIKIVTHFPQTPRHYRDLLAEYAELVHVTVEVVACTDTPCLSPPPTNTSATSSE